MIHRYGSSQQVKGSTIRSIIIVYHVPVVTIMCQAARKTDQWRSSFVRYPTPPGHHRREPLASIYENTRLAMLMPHRKPAASPTRNKVFGCIWWSFSGVYSAVNCHEYRWSAERSGKYVESLPNSRRCTEPSLPGLQSRHASCRLEVSPAFLCNADKVPCFTVAP